MQCTDPHVHSIAYTPYIIRCSGDVTSLRAVYYCIYDSSIEVAKHVYCIRTPVQCVAGHYTFMNVHQAALLGIEHQYIVVQAPSSENLTLLLRCASASGNALYHPLCNTLHTCNVMCFVVLNDYILLFSAVIHIMQLIYWSNS